MKQKYNDSELFSPSITDKRDLEKITGSNQPFFKDSFSRFCKNKGAIFGLFILIFIIILTILAPHTSPYYATVDSFKNDAYIAIENNNLVALSEVPLNIDMNNPNRIEAVDKAVAVANDRIAAGLYDNLSNSFLPPKIPFLENIGVADGTLNGVDVYAEKNVPNDVYFPFGTDNLGRDNFIRVFQGVYISILIGLIAAILDIVIGLIIGGLSGYHGGKFDLIIQRVVDIVASIPTIIILVILSLYFNTSGQSALVTALPIILAIAITG